ncbi:MAG: sugar phosphate isomerase/epimerase [Chthoniobacter sp.]|nr:sugar phosphate isomerase/epimerase [Chthoniobacter sp.]
MKFLLPAALAALLTLTGAMAGSFPDDLKTGGFVVGCQAWTFNRFSVMEAIDKTAETGAKVIEFFPGQKLSPDQPDIQFSHEPARGTDRKKPSEKLDADAAKAVWEKVKAKLAEKHITPVAYGVVGIPKDEAGARKVFEFAKYFGIRVINTESVDAIDTFEPLVKEYDIKVGFHDHPKRPDHPEYKMWDPEYILSVVKDRDPRIGSCADTGHWVRSGLKPVDCLRILKGRIVSSHLKDLNVPLPSGHDVPWGQGVSDVPGILAEYKAQNFVGPISVEYEYHQEDNLAEAKECIDYIRAQGAKK